MQFAHAGFMVDDLDEAIKLWGQLGFSLKHTFEKDEPPARAALVVDSNGAGLELWQFTGESRMNEIVGRHIAFKTDDARTVAADLVRSGFEEVIPFTHGKTLNYLFLKDQHGTYYEIAEEIKES